MESTSNLTYIYATSIFREKAYRELNLVRAWMKIQGVSSSTSSTLGHIDYYLHAALRIHSVLWVHFITYSKYS